MKHWLPFQAWHLSSGFVVKLFSNHWEWNLALKVHCKEILKPSIKNKLEVMCYLFSWTSMCTTQTIVDEELRHCHSQGKASGLGACHLSLDHNLLTSVTSQTQGKQMQNCPFEPQEIDKKWHAHEISSIHAIAAHHWKWSAQERGKCMFPIFTTGSLFREVEENTSCYKSYQVHSTFSSTLELLPFCTGAQFLNYRKWM